MPLPALAAAGAGLLKLLGGTAVRAGLGAALRGGAGKAVRFGGAAAARQGIKATTRLAGTKGPSTVPRLVRGGVPRNKVVAGGKGRIRKTLDTLSQALLGVSPGSGRALNYTNVAVWAPLLGIEAVDMFKGNEAVSESPTQALERVVAESSYNRMQAARLATIRKKMMEATIRLAQADPQLYQEVVMGQRLPRGARVFGQSTRPELMTLLASDMAQGRIESMDPEQQLNQLIGGM
jgi:hypothetical protein